MANSRYSVLSRQNCIHCGKPKRKVPKRGWMRALCCECMDKLPPALVAELDFAEDGKTFDRRLEHALELLYDHEP